jgi:hypothetical protein
VEIFAPTKKRTMLKCPTNYPQIHTANTHAPTHTQAHMHTQAHIRTHVHKCTHGNEWLTGSGVPIISLPELTAAETV